MLHVNRCLTRGLLTALLFATALVGPVVAGAGNASGVVPGTNGRLLFAREICFVDTDPCWEIVVASADDSQETVVAGPYARRVFDDGFLANWSPDGHSVIFIADLGTGVAIWQVNADGSDLHRVFAPPTQYLDDGPAFTPDGRWIIFTRCCPRPSGYGLWKVHPDGTGLRVVTTEPVPPTVDGPADNAPQVSPDGRTIVFQGRDDAGIDVWAIKPDGTGLTRVTTDGNSRMPSYSPDGTKIVFAKVMGDGSRDLFTMDPDGSGVTRVTFTPSNERWPQWAPAS